MGKFGLIKVGIDVLIEIVVDIVKFRLLLGVEPADQEEHGSHVIHNQWVFAVELNRRVKFCEDVFAHLDNVFRFDK